jgi:hydrogenase expression/formation protein HypD
MKYVDEFRDGRIAQGIAARIASEAEPARCYRFMEFCGGHTHAIARYGIEDLLPSNVEMIHGPGCPVCVLPAGRIDAAIALASRHDVTLCAYGDLMRAPGTKGASLLRAKAEGSDIRMIYSPLDALRIAREEPGRQVVLFAIGFETTTPPSALAIRLASRERLENFSVFCNHVLTPPAMRLILSDATGDAGSSIDGFVGPAHVSAVIGAAPYAFVAREFGRPIVVAGFEPLDVMQAALMLLRQVNSGRREVENQYGRAVTLEGNLRAQADVHEIFEIRETFEWRGLGELPASALRIREEFAAWDAERRFDMAERRAPDNPACECGAILRGEKKPVDCKLFGGLCTPDTPMGACMVSSEGACAAHWSYGRFRDLREAR